MQFPIVDLSSDKDLEDTGLAYLQLKNATEQVERLLSTIYQERELDPDLLRSDILRAILLLRASLES